MNVTGWTTTMDLQHARMLAVPAAPVALHNGADPDRRIRNELPSVSISELLIEGLPWQFPNRT
jgi:hypothetical protein